MMPATWPRGSPLAERLLVVDPRCECTRDGTVGDLATFVRPGDLLVVNDAATLPASLHGRTEAGEPVEVRLLASRDGSWRAIVFGAGDWTTRTEDRPPAPELREGEAITFAEDLRARVTSCDPAGRLVRLRFEDEDTDPDRFWSALYRHGRPVQYSYVAGPLQLWHVQTPFASRPWSSEMPSAARPLAWELLLGLRARGVRLAYVTHAAGLSSAGDARIDAALPLRESYEVPAVTTEAIATTRAAGGRVVAVGTTVVRALESAAGQDATALVPGSRGTELKVGRAHTLRVVDAIFTGMHEPGTSHDSLLQAFAPRDLLARAFEAAQARGFLGHEFGDSMLVGAGVLTG
jgi:S-adenosylmethionine:tRNA ribosyltransferase-isomerase